MYSPGDFLWEYMVLEGEPLTFSVNLMCSHTAMICSKKYRTIKEIDNAATFRRLIYKHRERINCGQET